MKNLERALLPKIPREARIQLMSQVRNFIQSHTQPRKIIGFGSVVTERFDACSDIDILAVYGTLIEADQARRILYKSQRPELGQSLEIICVDESRFNRRSNQGGKCAVAHFIKMFLDELFSCQSTRIS